MIGTLQQKAIQEVYGRYRDQSFDVVCRALRDAFGEAGLACPPASCLNAVAVEIAAGRMYVVGNGMLTDDPFGDPAAGLEPSEKVTRAVLPVGEQGALWFGTDPKVGHINPPDAVEHPEVEPAAVEELRRSAPE